MKLDFIYKRHSVRQFLEEPVPEDIIKEIIKAATYAPSGKNKQNWHFVVVTNKNKISEIAHIVAEKNARLSNYLEDEEKIKEFRANLGYHTVFKDAPSLILIYAGSYETIADMLMEADLMPNDEILKYSRPNPGIQNIAAAMENLQLAAANLGYGTCWMTGPTYAAKEISEYLGFEREGYDLVAMTPLGLPAKENHISPRRKLLEEVITIID